MALVNRSSRFPARTGSTSYLTWNAVTRAIIQNSWQGDCECRLRFQNGEIGSTDPELARQQSEKLSLAGFGILRWLGFECDDVSIFVRHVLIREALPQIPVPQIIFPNRLDRRFGLVFFRRDLGRRRRAPEVFACVGSSAPALKTTVSPSMLSLVYSNGRGSPGRTIECQVPFRYNLAGGVELLGSERLMILPFAESRATVVELHQCGIEDGQCRGFVFLLRGANAGGESLQEWRRAKNESLGKIDALSCLGAGRRGAATLPSVRSRNLNELAVRRDRARRPGRSRRRRVP